MQQIQELERITVKTHLLKKQYINVSTSINQTTEFTLILPAKKKTHYQRQWETQR